MPEEAKGIPSRRQYGNPRKLPQDLVELIIQLHNAERAGKHRDVRFGTPDTGLLSWATRKQLPEPGNQIAMFRQPVHSYDYKDFEGEIPEGYGKGTVKKERAGQLLITDAKPGKISFTTADERYPQRFVLFRPKKWQENNWLLVNTTPTKKPPYDKIHYKKIPAESVDPLIDKMQEGASLSAKIDGASSLVELVKDRAELTSYRKSKVTDRPIVHTERMFEGLPKYKVPKDLRGTVLKGELYGQRESGEVVPPYELGSVLNATLANAINKKRKDKIRLRNMLFDIQQLGKKPVDWHKTPYPERKAMIQDILERIPEMKRHFHVPDTAETPEAAHKLWHDVTSGKHPLTNEGIVLHPAHGTPYKSKPVEDADVWIREIFPGRGKYQGVGAGGFRYSLEPEGTIVGRVGTGLSDEVRQDLLNNPDAWIGRVARISSQQQLPSGAYRAPAFIARHEDYPMDKKKSTKMALARAMEDGRMT